MESLWRYYSGEPFLNDYGAIADFSADNNNSTSFKFKTKVAGTTEIMVQKILKLQYH